jgi:hypothetical protein
MAALMDAYSVDWKVDLLAVLPAARWDETSVDWKVDW